MITSRIPRLAGVLALAGAASAQFSFDPAVNVFVGNEPEGVVCCDLDGDGDLDVAVTSDAPDKVSLLFNNGNGTFAGVVNVLTGGGTSPHALECADVDGDGDNDLAVTLKNVNQVRILRNTNGSFALADTTGVGEDPRWITSGDFDGDGDVDLATSNRDGSSMSILTNDGAGNYASTTMAVGPEPRGIVAGLFDGDGDVDLAISIHDARRIDVFANNGAGAFALAQSLSLGAQLSPEGLVTADLDGNGLDDFAAPASGGGQNVAAVFRQTAPGVFAGLASFPVGGLDPSEIAAADFDVDGDIDLATSNTDSNTVSVLPNNGAGAFGAATTLAVGVEPQFVEACDLTGSGSPDIVAANAGTDNVSVLINNASGSAFTSLGAALAGTNGLPSLVGDGTLAANTLFSLTGSNLLASTPLTLVAGLGILNAPFKGGTLVPQVDFLIPLVTNGAGVTVLTATWPAGVPSGTSIVFQEWQADPAGPNGFAATNGLLGTTP